jgi:two-component system, cell cycle response regulator
MRPVERNELLARVRTQIRRHRYAVELRQSVTATLALAVTDELTGLYNRRYFDRHLTLMLDKAREQDRDMAVMLIDMDYFKAVNDTHGHDMPATPCSGSSRCACAGTSGASISPAGSAARSSSC